MNELPLSIDRRSLLKAGGALVISAALPATSVSQISAAASTTPDPKLLDSWIAIHQDNTATVFLGKVELGQGNSTTMLQLVAEELDFDLNQVSAARVDTLRSMNQGATVSSSSIERAGVQLRLAAAEARQELLRRAAQELGTPVAQLRVNAGVVAGNGRSVTYGALLGSKQLEMSLTGKAPLKDPASYRIVGSRVARRDIPAKVAGTYQYIQHVRLPEMLHGRVVRPRGQGAYGWGAKVLSVDVSSISHLRRVRVVRRGDFVGVVALRQWDAIRAAEALKVTWEMPAMLSSNSGLHAKMRQAKTIDTDVMADGDASKALAEAKNVVSGQYRAPYQAHAPFAPSCALADASRSQAHIICSSQDVFALRDRVAPVLGLPASDVRVQYAENSGCYGHNCQDDVAIAAAILSQEVGKPVRVQFMRWDELGWDNFGPAHVGEIKIGADENGKLVGYEYHGWHHGWMVEETSEQLALGGPVKELSKGVGSLIVNKFDAGGMYEIKNWHLVNHAIDGLGGYLKGANLRAPMDLAYSFASEQAMDELAQRVNMDPIDFRRHNIKNARWLGVLNTVADASGWKPKAASRSNEGGIAKGRGIALGTHRASMGGAVVDVEVELKTGTVTVKHVFAAMDCGMAINPDIVENQIAGMAMQGVSRVLLEAVAFSQTNVTSLDWNSYPVLRFGAHPNITAIVITNTGPPLGAGEEVLPAVGAAVANAVFDACGVRLHEFPMTPARVLAALQSKPLKTAHVRPREPHLYTHKHLARPSVWA